MVFLKVFSENINFEINQQTTKKTDSQVLMLVLYFSGRSKYDDFLPVIHGTHGPSHLLDLCSEGHIISHEIFTSHHLVSTTDVLHTFPMDTINPPRSRAKF